MKFQAGSDQMLPAVLVASRFVGRQANLPALAAMLISAEGGLVTLRATNLECGVEISFPAKVGEGGVAAVSGATLSGFLQNARGKDISASYAGDVLRLETAGSKASIKSVPGEDFPTLPRVAAEQSFTIKSSDLIRLLRSVTHCAATSSVKPELQSVYIFGEAGVLTAAATDSFRLAEKSVPLKSRGSVAPILFPARNAAELVRILESSNNEVVVYYSQNQLSVQVGDTYYTSRLIDGAFPNYRQIIPKEFASEAVVLREDFIQALRSLQIFTDKFLQVSFACDPKRRTIELASRNSDVGEETVTLKAAASGAEIKMNFNSRYLGDAAVPITGESLRLRMQGPGKPLVVRDAADESYLYLAMPMNR